MSRPRSETARRPTLGVPAPDPGLMPRGLREATRALGLRKGMPTDDDRPPLSTFPGRRVKPLDGQLALELLGGEGDGDEYRDGDEAGERRGYAE